MVGLRHEYLTRTLCIIWELMIHQNKQVINIKRLQKVFIILRRIKVKYEKLPEPRYWVIDFIQSLTNNKILFDINETILLQFCNNNNVDIKDAKEVLDHLMKSHFIVKFIDKYKIGERFQDADVIPQRKRELRFYKIQKTREKNYGNFAKFCSEIPTY